MVDWIGLVVVDEVPVQVNVVFVGPSEKSEPLGVESVNHDQTHSGAYVFGQRIRQKTGLDP